MDHASHGGGARTGWVLAAAIMAWAALATAAPLPPDGRMHLLLQDGVARTSGEGRVPLTLVLERHGGNWDPLFVSRIYRLDCPSVLTSIEQTNDETRFETTVLITPSWRMGVDRQGFYRRIDFSVRARLGADGTPVGEWESREADTTARGTVTGDARGLTNGPCPPAPAFGEHPRFLFRREALPALRRKAGTPWGQAMLKRLETQDWSRSNGAVGLGLLYQLTGQREYADRARTQIALDLDSGWWFPIGPIHDPAHKATEAVLAYDLVHDTCPPEFRAKMRAAFRAALPQMFDYGHISAGNDHDNSNWNAQYRAAVGMLGLALCADAGDEPGPLPPAEIPLAKPPAGLRTDGAPVWTLDAPLPWTGWLCAGPLPLGLGHDGLSAWGGASRAQPTNGTTFPVLVKATLPPPGPSATEILRIPNRTAQGDDLQPLTREITVRFAPVDPAWLVSAQTARGSPADQGALDLWEAAGRRPFQSLYLYSVLNVTTETTVRVVMSTTQITDPCVYLSGIRIPCAEVVRLAAGEHPVLIPLTMTTAVNAHGRSFQRFRFGLRRLTTEDAAAEARHLKAVHDFEKLCRTAYRKTYTPPSAPDLEGLRWLPVGRFRMANWNDNAIGDRGWNTAGEGYTQHCLRLAHIFAHAYRNATGSHVSDRTNLGWVLPQATCRTVFSDQEARMHSYGPGAGPIGVDNYARGFGLVPPELQPAVFRAWQKTQALADAGLFKAQDRLTDSLDPMSAAFAFVNWPAAEAAPNPAENLPRAVVDTQRGGYTFRNRWQDGDDCVALFTLNRTPGGDWGDNCAGEFRFQGLGVEWAVRGMGSGCAPNQIGDRTRALPPQPAGDPRGETLSAILATNGSGAVAATLTGLTSGGSPVQAVRSFAVDYTVASGAPALLAVADRLTRETNHTPLADCQWQMVTVSGNVVRVEEHGFTVTAPNGAVLRATVVCPATLAAGAIKVERKSLKHEYNYTGDHWNGFYPRNVITLRGEGEFFVVMTVSKGEPPAAKIEGEGMNATVTVGSRTVRFAGGSLVLSPPSPSQ